MVQRLKHAFAAVLMLLAGSGAQAASFNQVTSGNPGQFVQVNVDLSGDYTGQLGGFDIFLNMQPGLFLGGIFDDASDGGTAPSYFAATLLSTGPAPVGFSTSGSLAFAPIGTQTQLRATSNNLPTDNLSKFSLVFAAAPTAPVGAYQVAYQTVFSVRDAQGVVNNTAFPGRGVFSVTVGPRDEPTPPIPLPAAGWLLLGALGAVAGVKRIRSKT